MPVSLSSGLSRRGLGAIALGVAAIGLLLVIVVHRSTGSPVSSPAHCAPGDPAASLDNTTGLAKFKGALTRAATKPVNVMFVGDSLTEGFYASSDATRFQDVLRQDLQRAYDPPGVSGGEGYVPLWHATLWRASTQWTTGNTDPAGPAPTFAASGVGMSIRSGLLTGDQFAKISVSGDRFWIVHAQGPALSDMGISLDGGAVQVVHTHSTVAKSGQVWDSGPLARSSHTIRVTAVPAAATGQTVALDGVMVFNGDGGAVGQGRGVRTWDVGFGGTTARDFASPSPTYLDTTNEVIQPNLIVIGLGANDVNFYGAAEYAGYLKSIIERYRKGTPTTPAAPNASILLWVEPNSPTVPPAVWQSFADAAYAVAQSEHTGMVDMYQRMGTSVDGDFFASAIHPNDAGHRMIADGLAQGLGVLGCAPISGIVLDNAGQPIAGACVSAVDATTDTPVSYAHTGADGGYVVWTPPGSYKLHDWDCGDGGYLSTWRGGSNAASAAKVAGGTSALFDSMARTAAISGRLTSAAGMPLAGMCVSATDVNSSVVSLPAKTGADGSYIVAHPPGSQNRLGFTDCNGQKYRPTWHANTADEAHATPVTPGTTSLVDVMPHV